MRPLLAAAAAVSAAVLAAACAGSRPAGAAEDPARLYRSRCTGCHRAYERESRDRAAWDAALDRMAPRAHLRLEERERLRAWLLAGASDAPRGERP